MVGAVGAVAAEASFAQRAFQPYLDSGELPGVITVFHKDGHEEISCLGFADVAAQRPMSLDDVFQQCSQTKGFCGVTVAQLIEAGKVALDDPIANYLPEFKTLWVETANTNGVRRLEQARQPLTLRHCLTHTGGFPFELANFTAMGGWSHRMPLRSVAATAAATPLLFEPGTGVRYSNIGIDVAAAVVEVVTGQRWEDVVSERILKPLGMNATGFQPTDEQLKTRIEIYRVKKGKKAEHVPFCASMPPPFRGDRVFSSAGAGLWTTARDQLKFYKMLMNLGVGENGVRILKEETVRRLLAVSQRPKSLSKDGYSLGFVAPFADEADGWFGHGGAWASQCLVNGRRKELRMLVVQVVDAYWPRTVCALAAEAFFRQVEEKESRRAAESAVLNAVGNRTLRTRRRCVRSSLREVSATLNTEVLEEGRHGGDVKFGTPCLTNSVPSVLNAVGNRALRTQRLCVRSSARGVSATLNTEVLEEGRHGGDVRLETPCLSNSVTFVLNAVGNQFQITRRSNK